MIHDTPRSVLSLSPCHAPCESRRLACQSHKCNLLSPAHAAQMYEGKRFVAGGFRQHELYFPDGSCPSEAILQRFLAIVEAEPGARGAPCRTPRR